MKRNCIQCRFFHINPQFDGWYPDEFRPASFQCDQKKWMLDGDDLEVKGRGDDPTAKFRKTMATAETCPLFEVDSKEKP